MKQNHTEFIIMYVGSHCSAGTKFSLQQLLVVVHALHKYDAGGRQSQIHHILEDSPTTGLGGVGGIKDGRVLRTGLLYSKNNNNKKENLS